MPARVDWREQRPGELEALDPRDVGGRDGAGEEVVQCPRVGEGEGVGGVEGGECFGVAAGVGERVG